MLGVFLKPICLKANKLGSSWGLAGFCRLWSPGFTEIAKPLYKTTKGDFTWTEERKEAFDTVKWKLLEALALRLPDVNKPFYLLVDEHK